MEMLKRFQASGRSGFYLAVSREGDIAKGDSINIVESDRGKPTIAEIFSSEG
jgi:MOSC domain-containing protein YiiM